MAAIDPFSQFPVEICIKVIESFFSDQDLVWLWTEVRNVSQAWRRTVDAFVQRKHLPTTTIYYKHSPPLPVSDENTVAMRAAKTQPILPAPLEGHRNLFDFQFGRICEMDPSVAIFSTDFAEGRCNPSGWIVDPVQPWRYPSHIIEIRHFANDTPLADLQVDWDKFEVRCDWRSAFTGVLYEEKLRMKLVDTWIEGIGSGWAERARIKADPKRPFVAKMDAQAHKFEALPYRRSGSWHDNSSREARKRRLARHASEEGIEGWVWLANARDFAKMQELREVRIELDSLVFEDEKAPQNRSSGRCR